MEIVIDFQVLFMIFGIFLLFIDFIIIMIAVMVAFDNQHKGGWNSNKLMWFGNIQAAILGIMIVLGFILWLMGYIFYYVFIATGAITIK